MKTPPKVKQEANSQKRNTEAQIVAILIVIVALDLDRQLKKVGKEIGNLVLVRETKAQNMFGQLKKEKVKRAPLKKI